MMTQNKSTLKSASSKNVSQMQEVCEAFVTKENRITRCGEPALIKTYGKTLCAKHGLEHLKDLNKIKKHGILF